MARVGHRSAKTVCSQWQRKRDNVESRSHHVVDRGVGQVEQGIDDLSFGLFDLATSLAQRSKSANVVLGDAIGESVDVQPQEAKKTAGDGREESGDRCQNDREIPDRGSNSQRELLGIACGDSLWRDLTEHEKYRCHYCRRHPWTPGLADEGHEEDGGHRCGKDVYGVVCRLSAASRWTRSREIPISAVSEPEKNPDESVQAPSIAR